MKKTIFALLALFCLSAQSYSQRKIDVKKTIVELNSERKKEVIESSVVLDDNIFVLTYIGKGRKMMTFVKKYDKNMKLLKEVELRLDKDEGYIHLFTKVKNKIVLIFEKNDKKNKVKSVFIKELNTENLSLDSKKTVLDSEKYEKRKNIPYINYLIDNENILIYKNMRGRSKDLKKIYLKVLDANFNEKWTKNIELPFQNRRTDFLDIELSNSGNVYFIIDNYDKKTKETKEFLYACVNEGETLLTEEIEKIQENVINVRLQATEDNNIIVAGFYFVDAERGNGSKKGVFYNLFKGNDLELISNTQKLLSTTLLMQDKSDRTKRRAIRKESKGKATGLDYHYEIDEIIMKDDGGVTIIAEHYHVYVTTFTDSQGRTRSTTHYEYDDILAISIDKGGEIEWERKIPKTQHTSNTAYISSYTLSVFEDKLYFIFNDNIGNHNPQNKSTEYMSTKKKKAVISIYELNSEGFLRKDILSSYHELEGFFFPRFSEQIDDNKVLLYLKGRKRTEKVILLSF